MALENIVTNRPRRFPRWEPDYFDRTMAYPLPGFGRVHGFGFFLAPADRRPSFAGDHLPDKPKVKIAAGVSTLAGASVNCWYCLIESFPFRGRAVSGYGCLPNSMGTIILSRWVAHNCPMHTGCKRTRGRSNLEFPISFHLPEIQRRLVPVPHRTEARLGFDLRWCPRASVFFLGSIKTVLQ